MIKKSFKASALAIVVAGSLASGVAQAEFKIGVAGPHTGPYASFGEQLWRGATKAAESINANGGINGEKVVVIKGDDRCEPKEAVSVANRLVDYDGVMAVVGHFCSSSTIPASDVYDESGTFMITPGSTSPTVTDRGMPGIFRITGRDDQQGIVAANFMANDLGAKRIAIIHDKDTYGQGLANATRDQLNSLGITEVLYEGLTRGEKDFNALVTKIKSKKAEVVFFGGLHSEAGPLVRQMREQGLTAKFISGDGIVSEEFIKAAGGTSFVNGVMMTFGADPRDNPAGKTIITSFREDGYEPEGYTLYSYAGIQVIAAAFNGTGSNDPIKAAEWLHANGDINTVMGAKTFDNKGDLTTSNYIIYEWDKNGAYAPRK